jgi:hypothetical protein
MVTEVIYGTDVQAFMNGTLIACGQSISLKSTRKEIAVTCAGTGDTERSRVGKMKHTFTIQGLWRVAPAALYAANVDTYKMWDLFLKGEEVTIEFKRSATIGDFKDGDVTYTGIGYIKDMGMDAQLDEAGKTDLSGMFNSLELDKTPAPIGN